MNLTCTDVEARLLAILASLSTPTSAPAEPAGPAGRYDGDIADPHEVVDYLRSWDTMINLVDEHVATGHHAPYMTAIGQARLASGASVIVAKRAVEILVARRTQSTPAAVRSGRDVEQPCE